MCKNARARCEVRGRAQYVDDEWQTKDISATRTHDGRDGVGTAMAGNRTDSTGRESGYGREAEIGKVMTLLRPEHVGPPKISHEPFQEQVAFVFRRKEFKHREYANRSILESSLLLV